MKTIACLGLGAMGSRMAKRLLAAGYRVQVWNRSLDKAVALVPFGAIASATPRDAVSGADIALSMVFDDAASKHVWIDPAQGALAALSPNAIAIESSTLSLDWVSELAAHAHDRGVRFIDAPVAGSRPQADAGQLIFMAGGDAGAIDAAREVFAALGGALHHVGPSGSGALLKLAVNALFGVQVATVAELLNFLERRGADTPKALEALRAMPVMSPAAAGAGGLMLAKNFAPQAPIDLIAKDLDYALAAARERSVDLPATQNALAAFARASRAGYGAENIVAVSKLFS